MAFPTSPVDGQQYTTSLGTVYEYVAADDKWILVSTTLTGATGVQGVTGVAGTQGATGLQGETGLQGADGSAGAQGDTGVQGVTGLQGVTGAQGDTGTVSFAQYDAGTMTTDKNIDWSNGKKQELTVAMGAAGSNIYFTNGTPGANTTLVIDFDVNEVPGFTGLKWSGSNQAVLSGQTGVKDIISVYYDGTDYLAQASVGFDY
jgi:hypothetical protein